MRTFIILLLLGVAFVVIGQQGPYVGPSSGTGTGVTTGQSNVLNTAITNNSSFYTNRGTVNLPTNTAPFNIIQGPFNGIAEQTSTFSISKTNTYGAAMWYILGFWSDNTVQAPPVIILSNETENVVVYVHIGADGNGGHPAYGSGQIPVSPNSILRVHVDANGNSTRFTNNYAVPR